MNNALWLVLMTVILGVVVIVKIHDVLMGVAERRLSLYRHEKEIRTLILRMDGSDVKFEAAIVTLTVNVKNAIGKADDAIVNSRISFEKLDDFNRNINELRNEFEHWKVRVYDLENRDGQTQSSMAIPSTGT